MVDKSRRTFLTNTLLTSSVLAAAGRVEAQNTNALAFERIAVEETFTIPEVQDARRALFERDPNREPGLTPPPYVVNDTIRTLYDLGDGRIVSMDAAGVDKQVLSLWSPGLQIFDPGRGTELARLVNDRLADAIRRHPNRFAGLASVAPQDPDAAALEIERAVSGLGLNGVLINSHTNSEFLDDPKYWTVFEAVQALNTPIYLHPRTPPVQMYDAVSDYSMGGALWGFAAETSLHVVRLIMGGVFEEFPELQLVLGHMGEGLPFWLDRLDQVSARPGMPQLSRKPSEIFRNNIVITTSAMFWDPVLLFCISVLGVDRIMFGVDSPFASSERGTEWMDAAPVSEADRRKIYQENAERIFSL